MNKILNIDEQLFSKEFPTRPFLIKHNLMEHALFQLPRLMELCRTLPEKLVEYNAGSVPVGLDPTLTPRTGLSPEETIKRIAECKSWLVLKHVERDPEYAALLNSCLDEVMPLARKSLPETFMREGFVFISSPGSVTPYHIDHEHNFLLQVRGLKTMHVFDGTDRSILSEEQIENFYTGAHRNLPFSDEVQKRAQTFTLNPGVGLHVPINFPHWVQNGPEVSISFSITFHSRFSERRSRIYVVNAHLRKIGISPKPFGKNDIVDSTKYFVERVVRRVGTLFSKGDDQRVGY